jgi:hypothetical protein
MSACTGQLYAAVLARAKPSIHLWAPTDERCTCCKVLRMRVE